MDTFVSDGFEWWAIKLTVICVALFALSQAMPWMYSSFVLDRTLVLQEPWRVVTHIFMHADFSHLYFNMFALAVFGSIFEKHVGSRTFLTVFFIGGLASSVADVIFYSSTLGASGAIFAVLGCLAIFRPRAVVWAIGVPMYVIVAFLVWIAIDFLGMFQPGNIAHASHLAGMAYGSLYGLWLRRERPESGKPRSREDPDDLPTEKELEEWEEQWMLHR